MDDEDPFRIALEELVLQTEIEKLEIDHRVNVAHGALKYASNLYLALLMRQNLNEQYRKRVNAAYDAAINKQKEEM